EKQVDYAETKRLVQEMIDQLPEQQRMAVVLYYLENLSVGQIARMMECSEGTVKSRLNYGRKAIKTQVLALEKKGTKLYCMPLVPFLYWMFRQQVLAAAAPAAVGTAVLQAAGAGAMASGAANAAGAASGAGNATGMGAASAAGKTVAASGAGNAAGAAAGGTATTGTSAAGGTATTGTSAAGAAAGGTATTGTAAAGAAAGGAATTGTAAGAAGTAVTGAATGAGKVGLTILGKAVGVKGIAIAAAVCVGVGAGAAGGVHVLRSRQEARAAEARAEAEEEENFALESAIAGEQPENENDDGQSRLTAEDREALSRIYQAAQRRDYKALAEAFQPEFARLYNLEREQFTNQYIIFDGTDIGGKLEGYRLAIRTVSRTSKSTKHAGQTSYYVVGYQGNFVNGEPEGELLAFRIAYLPWAKYPNREVDISLAQYHNGSPVGTLRTQNWYITDEAVQELWLEEVYGELHKPKGMVEVGIPAGTDGILAYNQSGETLQLETLPELCFRINVEYGGADEFDSLPDSEKRNRLNMDSSQLWPVADTTGEYFMESIELQEILYAGYEVVWSSEGTFHEEGTEGLFPYETAAGESVTAPEESVGATAEEPLAAQQAGADRAAMAQAYREALEGVYDHNVYPDGTDCMYSSNRSISENRFAVCDIDQDGADELILSFTTSSMAGMTETIYKFDPASGTVKPELREFPALTYYDNGIIKAGFSHNHTLSEDFQPYSLYRYDEKNDRYEQIASVEGWQLSNSDVNYDGQPYPAEADPDQEGIVFYIMPGEEYAPDHPVSKKEYEAWYYSMLGTASEIDVPYQMLTPENISAIQ
ncbi:MAG: RNA polymerase sigma factor, partial [Clostridium sp.]|nr:RNA polymerase sigma factor [Clostridium sp.]